MIDHKEIISQVTKYLINFVECPHNVFSNLPVCPFAKKARLRNKIQYHIHSLKDIDVLIKIIEKFRKENAEDNFEALFLLDSDKSTTENEIEKITDKLTMKYHPELQMFAFHPNSKFKMNDLYTRRMPHPGIIIQRDSEVLMKEKLLKKTHWYDKLTRPICNRTSIEDCFCIKKYTEKGKGLFSNKSWLEGEDLFKLSGIIKPINECSILAIQISDTHCIESAPEFNDYILNHSCDPNCKISFKDQLTMQAIKNIDVGQELTWDYDTTEEDMRSAKCEFTCSCGSKNCRKEIIGFKYHGHLPEWIRSSLSR